MNILLYKGETIVFILVKGGNEHEAFCLAHDHVVVLEEQEEVQGRQVVLVVAVQELEGVQHDEIWHGDQGLLLELDLPEEQGLLAEDLSQQLQG